MSEDAVLTIPEVAALLKISERTIYAMAKEGRLPGAVKVGGSWRVLLPKLMGWLEANSTPARPEQTDKSGGGET